MEPCGRLESYFPPPHITAHELALEVGISEQAIRRIIAKLHEAGYITRKKEGKKGAIPG